MKIPSFYFFGHRSFFIKGFPRFLFEKSQATKFHHLTQQPPKEKIKRFFPLRVRSAEKREGRTKTSNRSCIYHSKSSNSKTTTKRKFLLFLLSSFLFIIPHYLHFNSPAILASGHSKNRCWMYLSLSRKRTSCISLPIMFNKIVFC
jgi:hypothetical protein